MRVIRDKVVILNPQSHRLLIHIDAAFHLAANVMPTPNGEIGETDDG
jgi:hypothetical protein